MTSVCFQFKSMKRFFTVISLLVEKGYVLTIYHEENKFYVSICYNDNETLDKLINLVEKSE